MKGNTYGFVGSLYSGFAGTGIDASSSRCSRIPAAMFGYSGEDCAGVGRRLGWTMMGHSRKKVRRHKKRMGNPLYQMEKGLLKLRHMFEAEDPFMAYTVFSYLVTREHTPQLDTYKAIVEGFDEVGTIGDVYAVLEEMDRRRIDVDVEMMQLVLRAQARRRLFDSMQGTFARIQGMTNEIPAEVFRIMVNGYAQARDTENASRAFKQMLQTQSSKNSKAFEAKMEILRLKGDPDELDFCFFDMTESYGFEPTHNAASLRIEAFADADSYGPMEEAFSELETLLLPITERNYEALINAYAKAGMMNRAMEHYEGMKKRKVVPTDETMKALFEGFVKAENIGGMELVMRDLSMYRIGPIESVLDDLIEFYAMRSMPVQCSIAVRRKYQADMYLNLSNWNVLWEAAGLINPAMRPPSDLKDALLLVLPGFSGNFHFSAVFDYLLLIGAVEPAQRCLAEMEAHGLKPNLALFHTIIRTFCGRDSPDLGLELLDELERNRFHPSRRTLVPILKSYTLLRDVEGVVGLFTMMFDYDHMPRYQTRLWIYQRDWREPAVLVALATDLRHRIPYQDAEAVDEYEEMLQAKPAIRGVRRSRRGRENDVERNGVDIDRLVDEARADTRPFVGDAAAIFQFLRRQVYELHRD
ncbi:hypothetical protein NDN08_007784 [Rhodosorus marinus]|uniref:Pentatricopeptide repeat-containing protein-mitochondrial domain-containing protein n=1 Tax=Rhodosorus marinus TaxID=101924 RepID=A0AAV8V3A2_9RHOD|nr:hypothetical protein NDN08_007784 [Rhodosorus marinus]